MNSENDEGAAYECDQCGACCRAFEIFASESDAIREPRVTHESRRVPPHARTRNWAYQLAKLPFHEGCCFLGADSRCGVYATRPEVCRGFAAGSDQCQAARRVEGLGRLLPVNRR